MARTKQPQRRSAPAKHPRKTIEKKAPKPKKETPLQWTGAAKLKVRIALEQGVMRNFFKVSTVIEMEELVRRNYGNWVVQAIGQKMHNTFFLEVQEICMDFMWSGHKKPYFEKLREVCLPMNEVNNKELWLQEDEEFGRLCDADPKFEPAWRKMQADTLNAELELIQKEQQAKLEAKRRELFEKDCQYYQEKVAQDPTWARRYPKLAEKYLGYTPMPDYFEDDQEERPSSPGIFDHPSYIN